MSIIDNRHYDLLDQEEETPWISHHSLEKHRKQTQPHFNRKTVYFTSILTAFIMFFCGILTGYNFQVYIGKAYGDAIASDLGVFHETHFESHPRRYNGSFFRRSKYGGTPSPEIDSEWARFADTGSELMPLFPALLNVTKKDFESSTGYTSDTAVRYEEPNQGYMVSLEMFHQIHCLDMIRKFMYFEYYEKTDPEWATAPLLREHAGHCVDMLRDVLMCSADTGLITYHWIKGYSSPMPDFSTMHSCRDPEAILQWTRNHEVHFDEPIVKKEGATELPKIF